MMKDISTIQFKYFFALIFSLFTFISSAQIPTNGLVASFPFNGNADDESGNSHDGTVNGATLSQDRFGNPNSSYTFDGDDYIVVADHDDLSFTSQQFSISFWIKAQTNTTPMGIISKRQIDGIDALDWEYNIETSASDPKDLSFKFTNLRGNCDSYINMESDTDFKSDEWIHYVITADAFNSNIYKNGVLFSEGDKNWNCFTGNGTGPLVFGKGGGFNQNLFFDGEIDDIYFYNKALSDTEISQLYGNFYGYLEGLVICLPFSGNADDESGNGHNGIVNGAELVEDRFNNPNSAYLFDGVDDYIQLNETVGNFEDNDFSISCWLKTSGNAGERTVFGKRNAGTYGNYVLFGTGTGKIGYEINESDDTNHNYFQSTTSINTNEWMHVVIIREWLDTKIYINGILDSEESYSISHSISNNVSSILGARFNGNNLRGFYQGTLDDFYIYDRAISESEVNQLYGDYQPINGNNNPESQLALINPIRGNPVIDITAEFNRTEWYYIAYTKSSDGSGKVYINGNEVGQLQWNNDNYLHSKLNIGSHYFTSYDQFFSGSIDEIKVSNIDIDGTSIKSYFETGSSLGSDNNTLSLWNFNEGSGDQFFNSSNDLVGQLIGQPEWVDGKFGKAIKYDGVDDRGEVFLDLPESIFTYEMWVRFDGDLTETFQTIIQPYGLNNTQFTIKLHIPEIPVVQFEIGSKEASENETVVLPVTVQNFQNILTTQYTISWDPAVIQYRSVQDFGLNDLSAADFHLFEPGKLTFSWNPDDLQPVSVNDNTVIFNITFDAVGNAGDETDVSFSDDPTPKEVSDGIGNVLEANYTNGNIALMQQVVVGGYIKTQKGEPLVDIEVKLSGAKEMTSITDQSGWYSFTVLPNKEYEIAPQFDTDADDGVSTLDIAIMHWHILGQKYMMSNYDLIACDVNNSKSLSTLDLAETRAIILHTENQFRNRRSIEFVNDQYTGTPGIFNFENKLAINPDEDDPNLNFTAVKLGDASRSWEVNKAGNGRNQQLEEIELIFEKEQVAGNRLNLPIKFNDNSKIVGLQFTLEWDPEVYAFEKLSGSLIEFNSNLNLIREGKLTVSWNHDRQEGLSLDKSSILSFVEFTILDEDKDPKIGINSSLTPALAFNSNLETLHVKSKIVNGEYVRAKDISVYPNPADDHISIISRNEELKHYSILSTTGAVILSGNFATNSSIKVNHLKKGIYILQVSDGSKQVLTKKFIKQ